MAKWNTTCSERPLPVQYGYTLSQSKWFGGQFRPLWAPKKWINGLQSPIACMGSCKMPIFGQSQLPGPEIKGFHLAPRFITCPGFMHPLFPYCSSIFKLDLWIFCKTHFPSTKVFDFLSQNTSCFRIICPSGGVCFQPLRQRDLWRTTFPFLRGKHK